MEDCSRCHHRMGVHCLFTIRTVSWKVGATRIPTAAHLQGIDVLGRNRVNRHSASIPRTSLTYKAAHSLTIYYAERACMYTVTPCTSVRTYWHQQDYYVEIDVVMDANTPLWKAHDLSQKLQDKLEVLPNVGRAFVHVDHETTHTPVSTLSQTSVILPHE